MKVLVSVLVISLLIACPLAFGAKVVLFDENIASEENGGDFAGFFTSHDAGSTVEITDSEKYMGNVSAVTTPSQSYNNAFEGWEIPINDYPYLTFAWKKDGGEFIMVQLAHDAAWAFRYFSGPENLPGWEGLQLDENVPTDWMVHTVNLVEDFGGDWNLTGIAFTPWDGNAMFFDFMVLHSDPEPPSAVEPGDGKLLTTWAGLKSE